MSHVIGLPPKHQGAIDQALSALNKTPRRRILLTLKQDSPLQQEIFETGKVALDARDGDTIRVELYHRHLPRLDECDYIDWEEDTGQIRRGEDFEEIRGFLELLEDHPDKLPTS